MNDFERINAIVRYEPETGFFYWKVSKRRRGQPKARIGSRADYPDNQGYHRINLNPTKMAHRVAYLLMTGSWPEMVIDHINRDKSDNRWENLRHCSYLQNTLNQGLAKNNTSGHIGVSKSKSGKWRAEYRGKHGGNFSCKTAAIICREQMERNDPSRMSR